MLMRKGLRKGNMEVSSFFIQVEPYTLTCKAPPGAGGKNALPDRYFVIVAPPDDGRRGLYLRSKRPALEP